MESFDDLIKYLSMRYDKNPFGWKITMGSGGRFGNIFVTNSKDVWQIKLDSIYKPKPIGMGTKIGNYEGNKNFFDNKVPYYGLRPIEEDKLKMIFRAAENGQYLNQFINELLKKRPMRAEEISSTALNGPIQFMQNGKYISERQREVDRKLKESLEKLLYREGYGSEYV
ncbi:MAG: hypothetical protein MOIL_00312 [Candidatus Methanolliviera sp. GoM_oil]|nr:MAG: hypothetical protein MOIL_00312 [Candidatus Methanolliviera sp. GoM_oil]